jgi:hypothetical protein
VSQAFPPGREPDEVPPLLDRGYVFRPCSLCLDAEGRSHCCWPRSLSPHGLLRIRLSTSTWRSTTERRHILIIRRACPICPRAERNRSLLLRDPTTTSTSTWPPHFSARPAAPMPLRRPRCPLRRPGPMSSPRGSGRSTAKVRRRAQAPRRRVHPIREPLRSPRAGVSSAVRFGARHLSRRRVATSAPS